MEFSNYL